MNFPPLLLLSGFWNDNKSAMVLYVEEKKKKAKASFASLCEARFAKLVGALHLPDTSP